MYAGAYTEFKKKTRREYISAHFKESEMVLI